MDNAYLHANILPALTEALTAMATQVPNDRIDFLGQYLLSYVDRKKQAERKEKEMQEVEKNLAVFLQEEEVRSVAEEEKNQPGLQLTKDYEAALANVTTYNEKATSLGSILNFVTNNLAIPDAYYAQKLTVAGADGATSDTLRYLYAGNPSSKAVGTKLPKAMTVEENGGEEIPPRQGISFEAFKIPEVPAADEEEGDAAAVDDEGNPLPPKEKPPPPTMQPLIVKNTMREKRVKFFGIPKLGSFVALPFAYASYEHDGGIVYNPNPTAGGGDGGAAVGDGDGGDGGGAASNTASTANLTSAGVPSSFSLQTKELQFILGLDTIGAYREITAEELARVQAFGNAHIQTMVNIEQLQADRTKVYLENNFASMNTVTNNFVSKIPDKEAAALSALAAQTAAAQAALLAAQPAPVAAAPAEDGGDGGAGDGGLGLPAIPTDSAIKVASDQATAVINAWNAWLTDSGSVGIFAQLTYHELLLPTPCVKLLYVTGCILQMDVGYFTDICGDPDWFTTRNQGLSWLFGNDVMTGVILGFDPANLNNYNPKFTTPVIKAYLELNQLMDPAAYPVYLPMFAQVLLPWCLKAIAAKEAYDLYQKELSGVPMVAAEE